MANSDLSVQLSNEKDKVVSAGASSWAMLEMASSLVAVFNLPCALGLGLVGFAGTTLTESKRLHTTNVSEEWLTAVAASPAITQEGLIQLAKKLKKSGTLSVAEALTWFDAESKRQALAQEPVAKQLSPGAAAVIARAAQLSSDAAPALGRTPFAAIQSGIAEVTTSTTSTLKGIAKLSMEKLGKKLSSSK